MNDASLEELTRQIKQLTIEAAALKRDLAMFRDDAASQPHASGARIAPGGSSRPPSGRSNVGLVMLVAFLAVAVGAGVVWAVSMSVMQTSAGEAARQAVHDQMHGMKSVVQFGKFTAKNKVSDDPLAFDWILKTPVDPARMVSATPELLGSPPPVAVSAEITQGGKACRMTVTGATAALLEKLANGLEAKVTILMDVDQLGALQRSSQ
jgi:hypothetical protein